MIYDGMVKGSFYMYSTYILLEAIVAQMNKGVTNRTATVVGSISTRLNELLFINIFIS